MSITGFRELETLHACPLCGASTLALAFDPDVMRCAGCTVLFRSPRPTQAEIGRSYDTGTTYDQWHAEDDLRKTMWLQRMAILHRHVASGALLDVGTGDGRFLDLARQAGFETRATETSRVGASFAQGRGHRVELGQFSSIALPVDSFDAITLWHVLEHVPDPGVVLERARALLKRDGVLVIAVPNENHAVWRWRLGLVRAGSPFEPLAWGGEIHLTHFQPASLMRFLQRMRFEILEFGVDDVHIRKTTRTRVKLAAQRTAARVFRTHWAQAMYVVCRGDKRSVTG